MAASLTSQGRSVNNILRPNPMYDSSDSLDAPWYRSHSQSKVQNQRGPNAKERIRIGPGLCVLFAIIFDILLVAGLGVFEYFLRCSTTSDIYQSAYIQDICRNIWKNIFSVRKRQFSCGDDNLNYTNDVSDFDDFPFKADLNPTIVYSVSFGAPIAIFLVYELILLCFMFNKTKETNPGLCPSLRIPQTIRRIHRFIITYLFGCFCMMIMIEIVKLSVGQLRPTFYETCEPLCSSAKPECTQTNVLLMKEARTSFPSMQSALTMYAAVTISIYFHGINRIHHGRYVIIPFLCLLCVLASICVGVFRLGRNYNWWTDIVIGHLMGAAMAVYLSCVLMRGYIFQESISNRKLSRQISFATHSDRSRDNRELSPYVIPYNETQLSSISSARTTNSRRPLVNNTVDSSSHFLPRVNLRAAAPLKLPPSFARQQPKNGSAGNSSVLVAGLPGPNTDHLSKSLQPIKSAVSNISKSHSSESMNHRDYPC